MKTVERAEKVLSRARLCVEMELWELEAEAQRRFRDGRSFSGLTESVMKWKHHLTSVEEAEMLLAEVKQAPVNQQRPICETIIRNLGGLSDRIVTHH